MVRYVWFRIVLGYGRWRRLHFTQQHLRPLSTEADGSMDNTGEISECDSKTPAILIEGDGAGVEIQRDANAVSCTVFLAVLLPS